MRHLILGLTLSAGLMAASSAWADPARICLGNVDPADQLNGLIVVPDQPEPLIESVLLIYGEWGMDCVPFPGAQVVVTLTELTPTCTGSQGFSGTLDPDGRLELPIYAGGCADGVPGAATISINGVTVRSYANVKSPDFDGNGADGVVDIVDLSLFSQAFLSAAGGCHDYNNNGVTAIEEVVVFGRAFTQRQHCGN